MYVFFKQLSTFGAYEHIHNIIIIRLLLCQYPQRSSSVARQNQGIKQTRNHKTLRESSMDGLRN